MLRYISVFCLCLLFCANAKAEDLAFSRIQKNQEINCGVYVLGSIFTYGTDGKPQGFTTDLFKEVGERTGLKIKYTEISSFSTIFEDLKMGRYDMICAPLLLIPATTMKAMPGAFIMEDPINIYANSKADHSKITSLNQLDDAKYRFVGMDGELGGLYVPRLYPKAKLNLLPMGAQPSDMFMNIDTNKADFVVLSHMAAQAYETANPGKLKQVTDKPLISSSVRLFFPEGSDTLRTNMDVLIEEMQRDGTLEKLLKKNNLLQ